MIVTLQFTQINEHLSIDVLSPADLLVIELSYLADVLNLIDDWIFDCFKLFDHLAHPCMDFR